MNSIEQTSLPIGERGPTITITHTNEDGTLVVGTERGDGSRDALRAARFRWSRSLGMWFMPQSRGQAARRARIDQLAGGLRDAGFDVEVQIEEYDPAAAFEALQGAATERSDRLAERAETERRLGDARSQAAHGAVAGIPFGQPILVGHHSERHHRAAIARSDRNEAAAREHHANAARAADRSDGALREATRRETPVVMGRKVERLEAEERSLKRILQTATGTYADRMRKRHQEVQAEIDFLKEAIGQSGARQYTAADFQVGDLARVRGRWSEVARVNRKTLAFKTAYSWTDNYPYHEVTGRRAAGDTGQGAGA
jgi:uncharacterized protein DUF3560